MAGLRPWRVFVETEMKRALLGSIGTLLYLSPAAGQLPAPVVDYHQHLFGPATVERSRNLDLVTARDLIRLLDQAGIRRALVLSVAYQFGNPNNPPVDDEYAHVMAENDWTSQEVAQFPDRLRGFCSFNPLRDYALAELSRCAKDPQLHLGLKLHFGNSDVDLDNPEHVDRIRQVFRAANDNGMPIVVHLRSSVTKTRAYGAREAGVFLNDVLPVAPDIPVQIAHLAGSGDYDDPEIDRALGVFVDAIKRKDRRMVRVYFDVSGVAGSGRWRDKADLIVTRIRQLGLARVLYGSDGAGSAEYVPRERLAAFRQLPLTDAEFRTIANNIAPYMR
jgi:predicted TIM-barrel fold metal-dependent hydrolase